MAATVKETTKRAKIVMEPAKEAVSKQATNRTIYAKRGDTWDSIAAEYGISVHTLRNMNSAEPLYIGKPIRVPTK